MVPRPWRGGGPIPVALDTPGRGVCPGSRAPARGGLPTPPSAVRSRSGRAGDPRAFGPRRIVLVRPWYGALMVLVAALTAQSSAKDLQPVADEVHEALRAPVLDAQSESKLALALLQGIDLSRLQPQDADRLVLLAQLYESQTARIASEMVTVRAASSSSRPWDAWDADWIVSVATPEQLADDDAKLWALYAPCQAAQDVWALVHQACASGLATGACRVADTPSPRTTPARGPGRSRPRAPRRR